MLRETSSLIKAFDGNIKKSQEECADKLEEIRDLSFWLNRSFYINMKSNNLKELVNRLVFWCYMESVEISGYTLYLTYCGLYRNAFDNVRHVLESMIQAFYVDLNHPDTSLKTKLEILKEIEYKKEYHASRLLEEKLSFKNLPCEGLDCKGLLNASYSELSKLVHPSHEKVIKTIKDVFASTEKASLSELIDCKEVERILTSTKIVYDAFYVLVLAEFPDLLDSIVKDKELLDCVKKYKLSLLDKIISSYKPKHQKKHNN